jgi:hypothetical protein
MSAAIGALPSDTVAAHAPYIFIHADLADAESATALPTKGERLPAAMTLLGRWASSSMFAAMA